MNMTPLFITPLVIMVMFASLLCAAAIIAAAKTSSHTTRLLAKRYPHLLSEEPLVRADTPAAALLGSVANG